MKGLRKRNSFLLGLVLLTVYVLSQLLWWAYTLVNLHTQNILLGPDTSWDKEEMIQRKTTMIIGEGFVFLVLMVLGMYLIYRSVQKEINLASLQKNFLLAITHELKTPIASNRLYLQTLLKKSFDAEKQQDLLEKALKENARLGYLTHNLLLATNIENHSLSPYWEEVSFSSVVENIVQTFKKGAGSNHAVVANIQENITLQSDEQMLTSIAQNLLENAAKYSETGKKIVVTLQYNAKEVLLKVEDEGCGISKEDLPFIFKRFFRSGNEEVRETKGTGLGLYIVKNLCNELNASIDVNSNPSGTTFTVAWQMKK